MHIKDKKLNKLSTEYLKNIETLYDDYDRIREVGEVNFLKVSSIELLDVLEHVEELKLKHNYNDEDASPCDYDFFDLTDEMENYECDLGICFNMDEKDLFKLIKKYIRCVDNTKKYDTFAKILNTTCKLTYVDYDDHEYHYNEKKKPLQTEVDSNYVGYYEFRLERPIPLKIIKAMLNELNIYKRIKTKKNTAEYDKYYLDKQLDELAEKL